MTTVGVLKGWVNLYETAIDRIKGDDFCTVFTAELKYINQLKELVKQYPNEIKIQYINDDGSIGARVPSSWFRFVKPPTKRNYTEEQRKAMSKRMKKAREAKNENHAN